MRFFGVLFRYFRNLTNFYDFFFNFINFKKFPKKFSRFSIIFYISKDFFKESRGFLNIPGSSWFLKASNKVSSKKFPSKFPGNLKKSLDNQKIQLKLTQKIFLENSENEDVKRKKRFSSKFSIRNLKIIAKTGNSQCAFT